MSTTTRTSSAARVCLDALKKEITHVVKILRKREKVTFELPENVPKDGHISSPCNGGTKKLGNGDVQRALVEVFIAVAKAVARKPRPRK